MFVHSVCKCCCWEMINAHLLQWHYCFPCKAQKRSCLSLLFLSITLNAAAHAWKTPVPLERTPSVAGPSNFVPIHAQYLRVCSSSGLSETTQRISSAICVLLSSPVSFEPCLFPLVKDQWLIVSNRHFYSTCVDSGGFPSLSLCLLVRPAAPRGQKRAFKECFVV